MSQRKKSEPAKKAADPFAARKKLTFAQAEGAEPLPSGLKLKEMSPALRAALWDVIFQSIKRDTDNTFRMFLSGRWLRLLQYRHVYRLHLPADEFSNELNPNIRPSKAVIMGGDYLQVLGLRAGRDPGSQLSRWIG